MGKSELFSAILSEVAKETELAPEEIVGSSRKMDVVDARSILVVVLFEIGFHPDQIARIINKSTTSVHYMIENFNYRKKTSKIIGIYYSNIKRFINNNYFPKG